MSPQSAYALRKVVRHVCQSQIQGPVYRVRLLRDCSDDQETCALSAKCVANKGKVAADDVVENPNTDLPVMNWSFRSYQAKVRIVAWIGIIAIVVLSVVPADERPLTGFGPPFEHFAAFALVAGAFAIAYPLSLARLIFLAALFAGGIELVQVPLPTRHARVSDFVVDFIGSCFAIGLVHIGRKFNQRHRAK